MILSQEEVKEGMFVTVIRGERLAPSLYSGLFLSPSAEPGPVTGVQEDKSHKGQVLKVLAVSLPYVVIERLTNKILAPKRWIFPVDLRECTLAQLPAKYVEAMLGSQFQETA